MLSQLHSINIGVKGKSKLRLDNKIVNTVGHKYSDEHKPKTSHSPNNKHFTVIGN
jgi:hypothetical protein